jgi:RNase P/RNase MRP subunit p29
MNTVTVSETKNTVTVNETTNTVTVTGGDATTVTVATEGPQGPVGFDLEDTNKVDGSVIYYDSSSAKFKADATTTKLTLVDGGNF